MCENCYDEIAEMIQRLTPTPENQENKMNDELNAIRRSTIKTYSVTDNISFSLLKPLSEHHVTNVIYWLRKLNEVAPAKGKVEVYAPYTRAEHIEASTYRLDSPGGRVTFESMNSDSPHRLITFAHEMFEGNRLASEVNPDGDSNWAMPIGHHVSDVNYNIVHEWGHVVDTRKRDDFGTLEMSIGRKLASAGPLVVTRFANSLSTYGGTQEVEAYAECFTEWFLTNGKTDNFAAKWYAREYNWKMN